MASDTSPFRGSVASDLPSDFGGSTEGVFSVDSPGGGAIGGGGGGGGGGSDAVHRGRLSELNESLNSSWSEIQSRFESVEVERSAAMSAASDATSLLNDLEDRALQLSQREKTVRKRESDVSYFKRPLDEREQELEDRVEDVTLKGDALAALQRELEEERMGLRDEAATLRRRAAQLEQQHRAIELASATSASREHDWELRMAKLEPEEARLGEMDSKMREEMSAFLLEISTKQQELSQIEDVLRQEERQNKITAEQQRDEIETERRKADAEAAEARRKADTEAESVRLVSHEEAVAADKLLKVKRQELEEAAQERERLLEVSFVQKLRFFKWKMKLLLLKEMMIFGATR